MMEVWKDITGYNGLYQVSNLGRIRSLDRYFYNRRYGTGLRKGQVLSNKLGSSGYYSIHLTKNGKRKSHLIHRLIAIEFIPNNNLSLDINHKDLNKLNNSLSNLEWVTRSENCIHAIKNGRCPNLKGEEIGSSKLSSEDVKKIRELYSLGNYTYKCLSELFSISKSTIGYIINRKIWSHI